MPMEFRYVSGPVLDAKADLIVFGVYGTPDRDQVFKAVNAALDGLLNDVAKEQGFKGKSTQSLSVRTATALSAKYIGVLGLGDKSGYELADTRRHASRAIAMARGLGATSLCFVVPAVSPKRRAQGAQFAVEGAILGAYRFTKYRTRDAKPNQIKEVGILVEPRAKKTTTARTRAYKAAIHRGEVVGEAVCTARNFVNEPAGYMTPTQLASEARALAKEFGLKIKVLGRKECERLGMGMYLAVARGSAQEPKFIHLTYTPKRKPVSRVALVGKGVMFDSGGYSLKPSAAMEDMKIDMSGAAAVIAAMRGIATLGSNHEVHALAACCENLVSGDAYKLGDVLTSMDGTTVEINNTDAEGRLTLGDALTYAQTKIEPDQLFDFATLTGACMVALGPYTAGVMSNSDKLAKRWLDAAAQAGEDMWRLPLNKRLKT